jgi:MFS family permease
VAGLAAPPVAGHLVDRVGPRWVVIGAEVLQALGAVTYLVAHQTLAVAGAAVLLAAGQQLFYSSLFALISDVAGEGPKDRPFALTAMVRSGSFGLGGLAAGGLLSLAGPGAYRIAVVTDAASFAACALVLAACVRIPRPHRHDALAAVPGPRRLLSDRPFLAVIVVTALIALSVDFFHSGTSVYVLMELHAQPWLPGTILALLTGLNTIGATTAVRVTRRIYRTTTMALGAGLYTVWCAVSLAALAVPPQWRPADLLAATVVMGAAGLLFQARTNALAEAIAPAAVRGRYLAAFQYAFTVPGVLAPAIVALYAVAVWLPWLIVGSAAALAVLALRWLTRHLPPAALHPDSLDLANQPQTPQNQKPPPDQGSWLQRRRSGGIGG